MRAAQIALLALCAVMAHHTIAVAQPSPATPRKPTTAKDKKAPAQNEFAKPCPMNGVKHALAMRSIKATSIKCVAGRFPKPGWAISYWTDTDSDEPKLNLRILANTGWQFIAHRTQKGPPSFPATTSVSKLQAVDLNGDGTDELLRFTEFGKGGAGEQYLEILQVDGALLTSEHHLLIGYSDFTSDSEPPVEHRGHVKISAPDRNGKRRISVDILIR